MNSNSKAREDLKQIREDLKSLRSDRVEANKEVDAAREAFSMPNDPAVKILELPEFEAVEQAVAKRGTIDDSIADREKAEATILSLLGLETGDSPAGNAAGLGPEHRTNSGYWNGHSTLAASQDYSRAKEMGLWNSRQQFGTIELGEIADRDTFLAALPAAPAGVISTDQGAIVPDVRGIIAPFLKPITLLDLIPSGTTNSNIVTYVQVTAIPLSSAETPEQGVKPEAGITTVDATAPVRTIAGWIKMSRQSLDDVAALGTLMNTLLPYDVRRRLEAQVLAGDGVGQNLLGIMNTSGIGAPAYVAGDNIADTILRAMTVIILSDADPNFVTLNPITWQDLLLMRAGSLSTDTDQTEAWKGNYLYGTPASLQTPSIWGLTITRNRIVPSNTPLVGDSRGATLLVREGVNVKTSDSDQDDFIRNRVTLLAECRVALPVWRPSAFCVAALS